MEIGFIGLGHMGAAMARNLLKAGHTLTVHNRTRAKAEALAQDGATIADTPADAARHPVVIVMPADDQALSEITLGDDGVLSALAPGGVLVNMSTVSLEITRRLAKNCADSGRHFLAAPVFGRPDAAAAATLFIAAAGPQEAFAQLKPAFDAIAQQTVYFGDDPVHAAAVKISGNFMLQSAIEAMAEAFALVRRHGVDPAQYLDFMTGTVFTAPFYKGYGSAIAEKRFTPPGFTLPLALKDTRLAIAAAEEVGAPMPLADLIRDRFLIAISRGWSGFDMAALGKLAAENAGLDSASR